MIMQFSVYILHDVCNNLQMGLEGKGGLGCSSYGKESFDDIDSEMLQDDEESEDDAGIMDIQRLCPQQYIQKVFDAIGEITVNPGYDLSKKGEDGWRNASVRFGLVELERPMFWTGKISMLMVEKTSLSCFLDMLAFRT